MRDCRKCRDWRECKEEGPFDYGEIGFCRPQMMWLIYHLGTLCEGQWPVENNTKIGRTPLQQQAYFVRVAEIAGFVEWRLKLTGVDGKLLKSEMALEKKLAEGQEWPKSLVEILNTLSSEARRALNYISGRRRKKDGYGTWKKR